VLIKVTRTVLAVAAAVVLVWIGRRNAHDLGKVHVRLRLWWLAVAIPPYAAGSLCLAMGWRRQLAAFGHQLGARVAIRIWWRAQLARYVPTGLAAFASRAALAKAEGVPPTLGAASLGVELGMLIGWGSLAAAVGLPSSLLGTPLRILLGVAAVGAIGAIPWVAPRVARQSGRPAVLAESEVIYGVSVALKSLAFVGFAAALVPVHLRDVWLLSGAVQGASVIGIIGITPAGIGVRETAMVGMLAHRMTAGDAAAVAIGWRAFEFAFELAWLGIGSMARKEPERDVA
jgi:hypothetical protein